MYVNKTSKTSSSPEVLPLFYPYVYSSNFNEIKPKIKKQDISVLDIEEKIIDDSIDKYSLFF